MTLPIEFKRKGKLIMSWKEDSSKGLTRAKTSKSILQMHAETAGIQIDPTPPGTPRPDAGQFSRNQTRPKLLANFSKHSSFRTEAAAALAMTAMLPSTPKAAAKTNPDPLIRTVSTQHLGITREESISGKSRPLAHSGGIALTQSGPIVTAKTLKAPLRPGQCDSQEDTETENQAITDPLKERKSLAVVEKYLMRVASTEASAEAKEQHPAHKRKQSMVSAGRLAL